jgi:GDPmannose 4,6-dehydratase
MTDVSRFTRWITNVRPHEIYNLGAQSDAVMSLNDPCSTLFINSNTVMALCDCVHKLDYPIKIFQANSVEIFKGVVSDAVLDETNLEFYPKNPYAIGKLASYWTIRYYRETYAVHMSNGIIFNAESPRRHTRYVTQKITHWVRSLQQNPNTILEIGDLNAQCDWIHASDVALGAYQILQQPCGSDYIVNLGQPRTVREFITVCLERSDIPITWIGTGLQECGVSNGHVLVKVNPTYFRPYPSPIQRWSNAKLLATGWCPQYSFVDLIDELIKLGHSD